MGDHSEDKAPRNVVVTEEMVAAAIRAEVVDFYDCPPLTGHGPVELDLMVIIHGVLQRLFPR
jgi:Ser/Thr protein kinase RdoA (MazF antagonist)